MSDGHHLNSFKQPYLRNHLSYRNEIFYGDVPRRIAAYQ